MIFLVYDILLLLLSPLILIHHAWRTVSRGRSFAGFGERFGCIAPESLARVAGKGPIWVHAVSVGETMAVKPLLRELKRRFPERPLVLSSVTETGRSVAVTIPEADLVVYFPFDFGFAVARALRLVAPSLVIVVETEIWPNFLRHARRTGIPSVMVNGRISDRSFPRYLRFSRFFAPILNNLSALCMQSSEDARRIIAVGAPAERVHVTRNLKYDLPVRSLTPAERQELLCSYRLPAGALIITAGSTHAGEEEVVADIYARLAGERSDLFLVLVPRHPERAVEVGTLLEGKGIPFVRRSALDKVQEQPRGGVLLVDTIGELMKLYALSDVVFVGGSLVPVGGHNLLEPASVGAPVLFGPHMHNFREITALVLGAGAGEQVNDHGELEATLRRLLADEPARRSMGENGIRLMADQGGAAARHLEIIGPLIERGSEVAR
ncbi:Three-deoxy-D-manno-octulosonic-acid transferase domain protein [Geobacter metallireducens RCH3]|uniref:3-deoxy-D-manno-octulosonic acid transferase n=1 Tax=Geobacter metallireducens (strain ATCC 53774 / DSM 7210 / GS-15) TaxID=269799 RepID=Q39T51_GEOMG|nr:3-deoxy-D-manno-octulosonic acid transferase [Geobacter metallireducens]ABB32573.1 CMP-3-deoxy-D-manno-octulosonate--lipid A tetraacyldisaccharide 3-deoxy-D-manno-octulosonate transferase [Geobacter metallireducens GS-15]EHP86400.1 Three-deoxy-D-manno-octulosonic-acid transferase domain protein [Geobacter metallireducens RCH3]